MSAGRGVLATCPDTCRVKEAVDRAAGAWPAGRAMSSTTESRPVRMAGRGAVGRWDDGRGKCQLPFPAARVHTPSARDGARACSGWKPPGGGADQTTTAPMIGAAGGSTKPGLLLLDLVLHVDRVDPEQLAGLLGHGV